MVANLRRYRTVADTPTSRIASAPQGYIELFGRGRQPPGVGLVCPISGLSCLWYRYRVERKNGDRWEYVESGVSHDTFGVDDDSGSVLVDPDGAEILTSRKQVSNAGGYRKSEWTLIEGETIYVIGEHVTLGGTNAVLDKKLIWPPCLLNGKSTRPPCWRVSTPTATAKSALTNGSARAKPHPMRLTAPTSTFA